MIAMMVARVVGRAAGHVVLALGVWWAWDWVVGKAGDAVMVRAHWP